MNGWVVLLWSFVAALVLIIGGIFASLAVMGRIELFPAAVPSAAPTPEETGIVDTSYSVLILNGTPQENLDTTMRDQLINSGWPADIIYASESGSEDFETTTVYFVADDDELAAIGLAGLIGGAAVEQSDFYAGQAGEGEKQLTVVIGIDRMDAAPEGSDDAPVG